MISGIVAISFIAASTAAFLATADCFLQSLFRLVLVPSPAVSSAYAIAFSFNASSTGSKNYSSDDSFTGAATVDLFALFVGAFIRALISFFMSDLSLFRSGFKGALSGTANKSSYSTSSSSA